MISFGGKTPFEYVTCYNHTINLAVYDVIFPKIKKVKKAVDRESDDKESDDDDEEEEIHAVAETFSDTIEKMVSIINAFRKSTVKNGLLQAELKRRNLAPLTLTSFSKTRWNSLVIAAKRFLKLLPVVQTILNEVKSKLSWDDHNTERHFKLLELEYLINNYCISL